MHSFRIPGLLRRATNVFALSAIGLFGFVSCQQDPPSAPIGPVTYTAEFPQITSIHLRPQSAKWSIAPNDSGSAKLAGSVTQPIAEIELGSPPNNTVWITAIRAGVKAFSLSYAYDNSTKLKLLTEPKDRIYYPVNSEILRKIYPASDKQSFDEQLAKLLVDGDKLVDTIEISDLVAGGVDTLSVFREAMKYMVAKKQSIEQIAASWSLRIDLAKVHERIRLLAEEGVITDTSVIFPRYPVRVKDPVSLSELAAGGSVVVQGTFEGDSGLSGLGSKVFQDDAAVSGFKLTFSAAVNGTQKTWDLAKDAEATLSADASVAAGTYTLVVWMLDAGKRSDTSRATFQVKSSSVDNTPPAIEWIAPTGETILEHADSVLLAKVTATDASGVESVSIDGGVASLADGIWSLAVTVPVVDTGYVLEVVAKDAKGNETKKSSRVYRKAPAVVGAPVLTLLAPSAKTGNSIPFESTHVAARWKIEDATSEIDEASILIAGIAATKEAGGIWSARVPLAPTGEDVVVRIAAKNKKGLEAQDEFKVKRAKDTVVPKIVAVQGSRTLEHGVATAAVSWKVSDNHKLKSVAIQGKPVVGVDGVYGATVDVVGGENSIVIEAIDSTGNLATDKATLVLPVDGTLPKIDFGTIARTVVFDSAKVPVVVKAGDDLGIASVWIDGVLVTGADGVYSRMVDLPVGGRWIQVKAQDVSGNTKIDSVNIIRSKDAVPPKIAVVSGAGGVPYETTSAVLVWKVTDNDRIAKVSIKGETVTSSDIVYSDTVALVSGENRFPIYAEDATGNKAYDTLVVTRGGDAIKPVITLVSPSKDTTVSETLGSMELVFRVTDNEQVSSVKIGTEEIVGDAGFYKTTTNLVVGTNTFEIVARNAAGNDAKATLVVTRSADTQRPSISRKAPTKDTTVSDATSSISLSFSVTDNIGVKSVSIGGTTVPGTGEVYARTVSLVYGVNMIQVLAEDSSGLRSVDTVTVIRLDQTKPTILAKSPSKDTTVSDATSSISLSFTVTDNIGVKSVSIGGVDATVSGSTYSRTVSLVPGGNSFVVVATDAANNESKDTLVVTRSADATKPVIVAKSPSKDTTVSDVTSSIALSFTVTDNIGVKSVSIGGVAVTGSGDTYSRTVSLAYGANSFVVVATDGSNNESKDTLVVTRLDQTKPTYTLKAPTKDTAVSEATTSFVISVTASDNVGVSTLKIGDVAATLSAGVYSRTVTLANGANAFGVVVTDAAGNSVAGSVTITRNLDPVKAVVLSDVNGSLRAGSFDVTLSCATTGAKIYYTLDGEDPTELSTLYSSAVRIDSTRTLKARAFLSPRAPSAIASQKYNLAVPVSVSSGNNHTLVLMSDGSLWGLGNNGSNAFAESDQTFIMEPVKIDDNVAQMSAGSGYSMWVKNDGTLWGIGDNTLGQLADGTTLTKSKRTLIPISGKVKKVVAGASGSKSTMILKTDGTLWGAGENQFGQLGLGYTSSEESSPLRIATAVTDMSVGGGMGIYLSEGSVYTMGYHGDGRLGFEASAFVLKPTKVTGLDNATVLDQHAGQSNFVGKSDGSLWAFGWNPKGVLGTGDSNSVFNPTRIDLSGKVAQIATAGGHAVVLMSNGTLYACGGNEYGQIGNGASSSPKFVVVASDVASISAGYWTSLYIRNDNTLWGLGDKSHGALGSGSGNPVRIRF